MLRYRWYRKMYFDIDYAKAFASYTEQEQKEIMELANAIDVRKIDNVMSYGSVALKATLNNVGLSSKMREEAKQIRKLLLR